MPSWLRERGAEKKDASEEVARKGARLLVRLRDASGVPKKTRDLAARLRSRDARATLLPARCKKSSYKSLTSHQLVAETYLQDAIRATGIAVRHRAAIQAYTSAARSSSAQRWRDE